MKRCPACVEGLGCIFPRPCPAETTEERQTREIVERKAVREERDRIVSFLTRAASRFAEFAGGPARTNADPFYAEALIEAANQIARGEYRK
jgi:hypothetical protein